VFPNKKPSATREGLIRVEFLPEFLLPLLAKVGWAYDSKPTGYTSVQQLPGNHRSLDGLADAHVIGNEEPNRVHAEGHDEGNELIGSGVDGEAADGAERSGPTSSV